MARETEDKQSRSGLGGASEYRTRKDTAFFTLVAGLIGFGVKLGVDIVQNLEKDSIPRPAPTTVSAGIKPVSESDFSDFKRTTEKRFDQLREDLRDIKVVLLNGRHSK